MEIKHHKPPFLSSSKRILNYNEFAEENEQANYALGLLEGSQKKLQNPSLLISPLTAKEATVSSKIEGTVSTVSDVFLYEAGGKPDPPDTPQVANYRKAMGNALGELQRGRKISVNLIKSLHGILLRGVRHQGNPGEFRKDSVWIAERFNDPIERATYVPPEFYLVPDYMENIFDYLHNSKEGTLIKAGLFHYQFEAIHPFNDGNGRLGRLLIPLILFGENKLSSPILYLSGYFEAHRDEYISALHEADETGKYDKWLAFFLRCVAEQLKETQELIEGIYKLYEDLKMHYQFTKSPYLIPFIDYLFESPIFTIPQAQEKIKINSRLTVSRLVDLFKREGFIKELGFRSGHAKLYFFPPLLNLLSTK